MYALTIHSQVAGSGVFIGSADNAHSLEGLRRHGITHILNMAADIPNGFPEGQASDAPSRVTRMCVVVPPAHVMLGHSSTYVAAMVPPWCSDTRALFRSSSTCVPSFATLWMR